MRQDYVHCHSKWHSIKTETIFSRLESDPETGLTTAEAAERLAEFGLNQLPARQKVSPLVRFLKHFHDILIYILFLAAFITLVLGHYADTAVIVLVAVVNAAIGYFQEHKAEKALDDIREMLSPKAAVLRDGNRKEIDSDELTLGDIVLLSPATRCPRTCACSRPAA